MKILNTGRENNMKSYDMSKYENVEFTEIGVEARTDLELELLARLEYVYEAAMRINKLEEMANSDDWWNLRYALKYANGDCRD